jgi:hypothetical protein
LSENGSTDAKAAFLARVQRFMDEMLDRLGMVSRAKDGDESEARALRAALRKSMKTWERLLRAGPSGPRVQEMLRMIEEQASQVKTGDA